MPSRDVDLGFLAHPDATPSPGVVMIPDVRGLSDHFRELATRLAGEGFAVLAVDLYRRTGAPRIETPQDAMEWIAELSDPDVLADLQAALDFLAEEPVAAGRKRGITGFCMGGQYALLAACSCTGLSACVPFYGMLVYAGGLDPDKKPRSPIEALSDLTCPVLGLYGEEDLLIPIDHVQDLEACIARSPHDGEVILYPGAGHAFMNDTRESYRPEAARDAWPRMVEFLRRHLS